MKKKLLILLLALCMLFAFGFVIAGCEEGAQGPQGPAGPQGQAGADGEDGKDGSGWLSGEGAPNAQTGGNVGDFYLDEDSFGIYKLTEDGWEPVGSIMGAQGEQGEKGEQGATGPAGPAGPQGPAGATGANGEKGEQGEPGKDGVGVEDVAVEYGYNEDGREVIIFTFTFSDDTQKVVTVLIPRKVQMFHGLNQDYCIKTDGSLPELSLSVTFTDGQYDMIPLTEEMIVNDEYGEPLDFSVAGEKHLYVRYQGMEWDGYLTVYESADSVTEFGVRNGNQIIAVIGEDGQYTPDYTGFELMVTYADGRQEELPFDADGLQITNDYTAVGTQFTLSFQYGAYGTQIYVMPVTEEQLTSGETYRLESGHINGSYSTPVYCKLGEEPFPDAYIMYEFYTDNELGGSNRYTYNVPLTSDMLYTVEGETPFDNMTAGRNTYAVRDPLSQIHDTFDIVVYDSAQAEVTYITLNGPSEILVGEGSYDNFTLQIQYSTADGDTVWEDIPFTEEMIVSGGIDFDTAGEYEIEVEYEGVKNTGYFTVFDPDLCNIRSLYISDLSGLRMEKGTDIEAFLQENLIGKELTIDYYESVDGQYSKFVPVTREMLDITGFDADLVGYQTITVSYTLPGQQIGKSTEIDIEVYIDLTGMEPIATYKLPYPATELLGADTASLYEGNIISISYNGEPVAQLAYEQEGNVISCGMDGIYLYFTIPETGDTAGIYVPEGEPKSYMLDNLSTQMRFDLYEEAGVYVLYMFNPAAGESGEWVACLTLGAVKGEDGYYPFMEGRVEFVEPADGETVGSAIIHY